MATLRVWSIDSVETAELLLERIHADRRLPPALPLTGSATATARWMSCELAPQLHDPTLNASTTHDAPQQDARWSAMFDVVFLEVLRRAARGEPPAPHDAPMPMDLDEVTVRRSTSYRRPASA